MGIGGVEYHGHTWDLGHRKAKEILFIAGSIDAATAPRLGMVNKTMDIMGFENAIEQVFDIHELGHGNAQSFTGQDIIADLDGMKKKLKSVD